VHHVEIQNPDPLYRRLLCPEHVYDDGRVKPQAYYAPGLKEPDNDVSVLHGGYVSVEEASRHPRRQGAGCGMLRAGSPRQLGLEVVHTPKDASLWHCSIRGLANLAKPREACFLLAEMTVVLKQPVREV
jgi:hypothetical protein